MRHNYPGNVRELQYAVERAVIMADGDMLTDENIVFSPIEQKAQRVSILQTNNLEDLERIAIEQIVEKHKGNIAKAAKELGLTRASLYRRLEKYEL
jgi:transcriptional regulator with PAS, ATPase and Fis domain